ARLRQPWPEQRQVGAREGTEAEVRAAAFHAVGPGSLLNPARGAACQSAARADDARATSHHPHLEPRPAPRSILAPRATTTSGEAASDARIRALRCPRVMSRCHRRDMAGGVAAR